MVKELLPIVVAAAVWGPQWAGKTAQAHCDNMGVVTKVNAVESKQRKASCMLPGLPGG